MLPQLALAYALTAQLTCVFLGRLIHFADMREQALDQRSDADRTGFRGFPNNHDGSACK